MRLLPVLLVGVVLFGIAPASAFTATLNTPTAIQPGDLISISLAGLANNDVFRIVISSTNLVNTATSYRIENFSMPFGFQTGTSSLDATGSNVKALSMHVKTATDEVTYSKTGGPTLTVTSAQDIHKKVYDLIEFSGTPFGAGSVGVSLTAQGTVSGTPPPDNPANLNFILQGASSGDLRVQIFDGAASVLDQVITVTTPSNLQGSGTQFTPAVPSGGTTTLDFTTQTDTTLLISPNTNIPAGSSVTVTKYSSPPTGSTTPSGSTYKALGKYLEISSADLGGKVTSMKITVSYTPAEVSAAGLTEANLAVYYYNPASGAWEALPGGVDTTNHLVWGTTTHLSTYGVLATIPAPPPPAPYYGGRGGGGGGGGIGYVPVPETTAAAYQLPAGNVTTGEGAAAPPVTEMATPAVPAPAMTESRPVQEVMTAAATATKPAGIPLSPFTGVLGALLAAGIFISIRKS